MGVMGWSLSCRVLFGALYVTGVVLVKQLPALLTSTAAQGMLPQLCLASVPTQRMTE